MRVRRGSGREGGWEEEGGERRVGGGRWHTSTLHSIVNHSHLGYVRVCPTLQEVLNGYVALGLAGKHEGSPSISVLHIDVWHHLCQTQHQLRREGTTHKTTHNTIAVVTHFQILHASACPMEW